MQEQIIIRSVILVQVNTKETVPWNNEPLVKVVIADFLVGWLLDLRALLETMPDTSKTRICNFFNCLSMCGVV